MTTTIYCEGLLFGPDGKELACEGYERKTIAVDYGTGFHEVLVWPVLQPGIVVDFFRLVLCDKVLMESEHRAVLVGEHTRINVRLDIRGKSVEGGGSADDVTFLVSPGSSAEN